MNSPSGFSNLSGIIPPLVTPLLPDGRIDTNSTENLIRHVLSGGVSAVFANGTTGEGPSLGRERRNILLQTVVQAVGGRVPVLAGIGTSSLEDTICQAVLAAGTGAAAAVCPPPTYYPLNPAETAVWFKTVADRSPIPVFLYKIPGPCGAGLTAETAASLAAHPNIAGIKDSSGSLVNLAQLCRIREQNDSFLVFSGPDEGLFQALASGADGGVCSGANVNPGLFTAMYRLAKSDKNREALRLMDEILSFSARLYTRTDSSVRVTAGIKSELKRMGILRHASLSAPFAEILEDSPSGTRAV